MSYRLFNPPLYFTPRKSLAPHLRSWAELRQRVNSGAYGSIWSQIAVKADQDLIEDPITPASMFPGREPDQARHANLDFTVSVAVCQRVLRSALMFRVTGNHAHKECCLRQIYSLIDPSVWVEWRDKSHVYMGIPADLRTGWISRDVGIAYNWLRSSLTRKQRQQILDGIDHMGIRPFLDSLPMNPHWMQKLTNWTTCIVGGMGLCGMALGRDHPEAANLVRISKSKMDSYFAIFGPEGEFNESPGYAGSLMDVVQYYSALHCIEPVSPNRLATFPFPQVARWIQYLALGPKRLAGFGDNHVEAPPFVPHYAAVAAATRDPTIQGLCRHYRATNMGYSVPDIFEFIWLDPTLPAKRPEPTSPRYATFRGHAACFSSRTDWKTSGADCVVYGKAGREPYHAHADAGQICIDAHGERLIRDLGLPAGGYPADYFGANRLKYYNASVLGHNLLTINDREHPDKATSGYFLSDGLLPDGLGVHWVYDLSACHPEATSITRSVFHLLPNVVVIIDEAHVESTAQFRLRWHTAKPVKIRNDGSFNFTVGKANLSARVHAPGPVRVSHASGRHHYSAPFHQNRLGENLHQLREPFVDTRTKGKRCRLLTAFATGLSRVPPASWQEQNGTLSFQDKKHGRFSVRIEHNILYYETPRGLGSYSLNSFQ